MLLPNLSPCSPLALVQIVSRSSLKCPCNYLNPALVRQRLPVPFSTLSTYLSSICFPRVNPLSLLPGHLAIDKYLLNE